MEQPLVWLVINITRQTRAAVGTIYQLIDITVSLVGGGTDINIRPWLRLQLFLIKRKCFAPEG